MVKNLMRILYDDGFEECLKTLSEESNIFVFSSFARGILKVLNIGNKFNSFFNPHINDIGFESYTKKLATTRNYSTSTVRFIAWNHHCFKLAIAAVDDSIRIYTDDNQSIVMLLKTGQQKSITCLAWRPLSSGQLAVGCHSGFILWTLDPNSCITRPLSHAHFKHANHTPVTSIAWNSNGNLLASASLKDSSILIWNVDKNICVPLKKTSPPCLHLQWSLNNAFLFSSSIGSSFRVWNCEDWNSDKWTIGTGQHVQSFQWSPCAKFLLFVTSEEPILYVLGFSDEALFNEKKTSTIPQQALPLVDLSRTDVEDFETGGTPQQLAWNGKYLAISFKDTNSVAIFQTTIRKHQLNVLPIGLVSKLAFEFPTFITFQPNYGNSENVLTIAWSSGEIQFVPFN